MGELHAEVCAADASCKLVPSVLHLLSVCVTSDGVRNGVLSVATEDVARQLPRGCGVYGSGKAIGCRAGEGGAFVSWMVLVVTPRWHCECALSTMFSGVAQVLSAPSDFSEYAFQSAGRGVELCTLSGWIDMLQMECGEQLGCYRGLRVLLEQVKQACAWTESVGADECRVGSLWRRAVFQQWRARLVASD
jgi:hypothetical protein